MQLAALTGFERIEAQMQRRRRRRRAVQREEITVDDALHVSASERQDYKVELMDADPRRGRRVI